MNDDHYKIIIETTKAIAKEVYQDGLQPTVKNVGDIGGTITGFFNHVILYPLKRVNTLYEEKAIKLAEELNEKVDQIPQEQRREAPINILGPTMEALKYNIDEEELRRMFVNLLSNSMDIRKSSLVHPSFVKIIEQMSSTDAILFRLISANLGFQNAIRPSIIVNQEKNLAAGGVPQLLIDYNINGLDMFDVSRSMVRLEKFGLITTYDSNTAGVSDAKHLLKRNDFVQLLNVEKTKRRNPHLIATSTNVAYHVNDYGIAFKKVCV